MNGNNKCVILYNLMYSKNKILNRYLTDLQSNKHVFFLYLIAGNSREKSFFSHIDYKKYIHVKHCPFF